MELPIQERREVRTDKYNNFNHSGEIVATPDGSLVGKKVWFKHTLAMNLEDSRDYMPDGFNENYWRFLNGEDVDWLDKSNERIRYYPSTEELFLETVVCEDVDGDVVPLNDYIPYIQGEKHKQQGRILLFNQQSWQEGVGYVFMDAFGIPKDARIYYWKNSGYPNEIDTAKWIEKDKKRICFVKKHDIFGWDAGDGFVLNDGWSVIKCTDEEDEWQEDNGIWIPRKIKNQKGWGNVLISKIYNEGDRVFFLKRAYFSFVLNGELLYAVPNKDGFLADPKLINQVHERINTERESSQT